jgi:HAD superfamily hydrolase (TIGR01450 family)
MAVAGVMFDLDGTLILSDRQLGQYRLLPHAIEALEALTARGVPYLALTNGSAYPARTQAPRLAALGLPLDAESLFTPNSVAAALFAARRHTRVMVLGTAGVHEALEELGVATCAPGESGADAVYVAWHPECAMTDIHAACSAVLDGAAFYTASDVPFFATQSGPAFGYSCAISGAIARVTGSEPEVTGKPSLHALDFVAARLGVARESVAVVGDDPRVEIEMARAGGALGIGVTTGTTSHEAWAAQEDCRAPHHVIDSLSELFEHLGMD